ncbi:MAG: CoA-acylating methylmalonate-semialdehyde dehydrogenase [Cyanobacteriota bacterium]
MLTTLKYGEIKNFVGGKLVDHGGEYLDIMNPNDGSIIGKVALSTSKDLDIAVEAAKKAFPAWSNTTIKDRAQVFYRYKNLIEQNLEELATIVHEENGKTMPEARASIAKGIELTEFACSMPQLIGGEILEVSRGVECRIDRFPLGVVASILPFNFPFMVPNWTVPNALVLGNCMVLKPSRYVPISALKIAELLKEAGLPDGVLNIVNGGREIVTGICNHKDIEAVSFVGSTKVAEIVYKSVTSNLKRAVCLGSAKNHLIVLPDAHDEMTAKDVAASMTGCAGQRCMAATVMVAVGEVDHIIEKLCNEARNIIPGKNMGAIINKEAKDEIIHFINQAEKEGGKVVVDGRNVTVPGKENGLYVGPTIIDNVTPDMTIAQEEVFGPVLSIIRVKNVDEAIKIENNNRYGNASSVYTQSGGSANYVIERVSAGMCGVNIGVPVPREPFSFGGWNDSKYGIEDITGRSSIEFWTKPKKRTTKWNPEDKCGWMS